MEYQLERHLSIGTQLRQGMIHGQCVQRCQQQGHHNDHICHKKVTFYVYKIKYLVTQRMQYLWTETQLKWHALHFVQLCLANGKSTKTPISKGHHTIKNPPHLQQRKTLKWKPKKLNESWRLGCSVLGRGAEPLLRTQFLEHPPTLNFGANHLKKWIQHPQKPPIPFLSPHNPHCRGGFFWGGGSKS